jgi:carbamoyl-phosphate synthase small subunit
MEKSGQEKRIHLVLEDGTEMEGFSFGAARSVSGEVVFNTGMVGYPESLTDPSYRGQILVLTYPLIGNYGVPPAETDASGILRFFESDRCQVAGLVVSSCSGEHSHWNAARGLSDWLAAHDVPGIQGVDTRALTKKIRQKGTLLGKIIFEDDIRLEDPNRRNLVSEVSVGEPIEYGRGDLRIVVVDCGLKNNILRCLLSRGVSVLRVPWDYDFNRSGQAFQGLVVSNGPGDPKMCGETIRHIRVAMEKQTEIFGICLGNQLLALAAGADTYKLKYGHRSQNQPCVEAGGRRCYITSQNHGFAVDAASLPAGWSSWFVNANDGTNEGIRHETLPFRSIQFHPEASCGPVDTEFLFDRFLEEVEKNARR